jgi:3D (Asp-Asp-Asp) domain-containing protein
MFCSLLFASWLCFHPAPVVCEPIVYDKKAIATAYNLEAAQTDNSPCIGAGNHNLCAILEENPSKCIVATRLYPLHRKLLIEGFGECEVLDRTAKKYGSRIDILFETREEAKEFGIKEIKYKEINL